MMRGITTSHATRGPRGNYAGGIAVWCVPASTLRVRVRVRVRGRGRVRVRGWYVPASKLPLEFATSARFETRQQRPRR